MSFGPRLAGNWEVAPEKKMALHLQQLGRAVESEDWEAVILEAEELLDEAPTNLEALHALVTAFTALGQFHLAKLVFEQLYVLLGDTDEVLYGLALARFHTCDLPGALEVTRELVRRAPEDARYWYTLGRTLEFSSASTPEMNDAFQRAAALDPEHFSIPAPLTQRQWNLVLSSAIGLLDPRLQAFWEGVPVQWRQRPEIADLLAQPVVPSPTLLANTEGLPPEEEDLHARPAALNVYLGNLARDLASQDRVPALADSLEDLALSWMGLQEIEEMDGIKE